MTIALSVSVSEGSGLIFVACCCFSLYMLELEVISPLLFIYYFCSFMSISYTVKDDLYCSVSLLNDIFYGGFLYSV